MCSPASRHSTWSPPTVTRLVRSWPPVRSPRWKSSPRIRRPRPGCAKLATAGAFHTHYMATAAEGYAAAAETVTTAEPTATLLSNADGQAVASAADAMAKLVNQMTKPVRWDLCTETMRQQNVSAIVEFPPAGTLAGIAKRELRGVPTHAVKSPADLDGLAEL